MLCRGGVTFVHKMDQFIWRAQSVRYAMHNIIKSCVQLSPPSSHQPLKHLSKDMPPKSFDVDDARAFSLTFFEV